MIVTIVAAALLASPGGAPSAAPAPYSPMRYSQVIVRQQFMIQVRRKEDKAPPPQITWKEGRGPDCIKADSIAGAALLGPNSVDIILRDSTRLRVRLESSCPALDFYRGFYLRPDRDGRICADRDVIRSRMGGQCEIERFRKLRPVHRD